MEVLLLNQPSIDRDEQASQPWQASGPIHGPGMQSGFKARQQAADYLGISIRTFDRLRSESGLPFVKIGRRKKYLQRDLDVLILASRTIAGD